jgi:dipeptidase E
MPPMSGAVFLGGGGSAADSAALDALFAPRAGRLLYLPLALPPERHAGAVAWITATLGAYGVTDVTTWTAPEPRADLTAFDAVYVGGGNTYRLLRLVRAAGLDGALRAFAARGGALYGGSAGAILFGRDVGTAAGLDPPDDEPDTAGLDLLGGWAVRPHYTPAGAGTVRRWADAYDIPVVALSERAGLVAEDRTFRASGPEPAWLVRPGHPPEPLPPGAAAAR